MSERKPWTKEEDQLMLQIINERGLHSDYKRMKWNDIAQRISNLSYKNFRTGKQCRQRWFNHLHPDIDKQHAWTEQQKQKLFQKHEELGNHWVKISKYLLGRSENSIKNFFYCCLRKALSKVNNFLHYNRRESKYKNIKTFPRSLIGKFMTVLQKKTEKKIHVKSEEAFILARQIKNLLIEIEVFHKQEQSKKIAGILDSAILKIQTFNRLCKRKKPKKKDYKKSKNKKSFKIQQQIEQSQNQEEEQYQDQQQSQDQFFQEIVEKMDQSEEEKQNSSEGLQKNNNAYILKQKVQKSSLMQEKVDVSQTLLKNVYNDSLNFINSQQSKTQTVQMSGKTSGNCDISNIRIHPKSQQLIPIIPVAQPFFFHGSAFMPTLFSSSLMFNYQQQKNFQQICQPCTSNFLPNDAKESSIQKPPRKQSKNLNNIKPNSE